MLDTCLYVDDVISGADDISQALKVSKDAETIMKNASMKLRKCNSNDQTLMRTWEKEGLETHPCHPDDSSKIPSSKVLGIPWDVVHDYFTIDVKGLLQLDTPKPITKRIVLQSAGKIYDPVGFLSPYTIRLKCLLQKLWLRKLSWDDELPPDIHAVWSQWWLELPFLSELKIPRKILDSSGDSSEVQIHTFSDASQKAYGAAAFLRVKHKDRVSVDLVTSKSRVAPLKRLSLPRLELMGALLAARLAKEVKKILDQKCSTRAFFWTDSQVTLHWIKGPSHRWKPFVANRVREIQSLTDPNSWFHCSGKEMAAVAEWYRHRIVAGFVTSSSPVPLKTRRVGQRCPLNLSRVETSSRWCGVVVRRGWCQLRCRPRHLTMVQNYVVRRQKPSCS
ncbi:pro-Pol polyprotein [Trichonephila clavipes]|nr:pro-Pol polyprotein [Trichonephila clavipes]